MKTLLIVDDNLMMREFLTTYFLPDYRIITAENIEEALAALESKPVDLILLDYELEGSTGYKLLTAIKTSGFYQDIPVMFLSGNQKSSIRIECLEAGAADFVCKPFNPEELEIRISRVINHA